MTGSPPRLRLEGVSRIFEDQYALISVNASLSAGEVVALLGGNGAGKSTLLKLLSLQLRPSEGLLFWEGAPLTRVGRQALRRAVGLVGHKPMLYRDLSGRENLELFDQLHGGSRADRKARVDAQLEAVGLSEAASRLASTYSRGMQQRLALARALLPAPSLLLLDEPFSGLDQQGHQRCEALIEARRAAGALILLVTHDLGAAARLADRALILRRGKLSWQGRGAPARENDHRIEGAHPLLEAYRDHG
ncbi:MAG: ATP-binding cassette domain-containing protein [Myxococcota bacterium]|nr:ATP-binding cassette domain-containing protein [Myxococcota bacterium]